MQGEASLCAEQCRLYMSRRSTSAQSGAGYPMRKRHLCAECCPLPYEEQRQDDAQSAARYPWGRRPEAPCTFFPISLLVSYLASREACRAGCIPTIPPRGVHSLPSIASLLLPSREPGTVLYMEQPVCTVLAVMLQPSMHGFMPPPLLAALRKRLSCTAS